MKNPSPALAALLLSLALPFSSFADGAADNKAEKVRPIPPPGGEVSIADRDELQAGADALGKTIGDLQQ